MTAKPPRMPKNSPNPSGRPRASFLGLRRATGADRLFRILYATRQSREQPARAHPFSIPGGTASKLPTACSPPGASFPGPSCACLLGIASIAGHDSDSARTWGRFRLCLAWLFSFRKSCVRIILFYALFQRKDGILLCTPVLTRPCRYVCPPFFVCSDKSRSFPCSYCVVHVLFSFRL